MPVGNPNYDALLTTTINNYRKTLVDNVFGDRPLFYWLLKRGQRFRQLSGGANIVEHLVYAGPNAGSYGQWDAISITPIQGLTAAEFPWRMVQASIAISGLEEAQNNGEAAIINLLQARTMQAEESLRDAMNVMVYGDGTGNGGKDFLGLGALVASTEGPATVGGISVTDNVWWRSQVYDRTGGTAANLQAYLRTAYNAASKGSDAPDALFSDYDVFELYESQLLPNVRYSDVETVNSGFTNLRFKRAVWMPDTDAPSQTVYGLNSKYISLVGHRDRWFKVSKFQDGLSAANGGNATTVDARYALITAFGNMTVSNRARHFKVYNVPLT